jgi:hypothetical protein
MVTQVLFSFVNQQGVASLWFETRSLHPGVTINIAPLLSLSADQHSKFMQKRHTPQVFSLHLDAYRTSSQQKEICALLLRVASHGSISTSMVVFSSAQALTDNPI